MSEREVTIVIRGKNLTQAEFSAARKELAGVDDQAKKTSLSASTLGSAFKALGAAISVTAIGNALRSYADFTGEMTDLSAKTGIGVEALQRLKYAAEQNGGTLDQVTNAVTKLGANLAGGNASAAGALDALGLSFDAVRAMAPDQAFTTIADAIAKIPDPMAQSKLAMDLFGKSGAELLPMMKGNLSETAAAADRLGIVLSEDAVRAGDEFGDTMGTLGAIGKSVIGQVLQPMVPALTVVAQWLGEKLPDAVRFIVDALTTGLGRAFIDARIWLNQFILGVAEGVNKIPLLGEKIGFSAETIAGLRANVDQAKESLAIFTQKTLTSSMTTEAASRTVGTLNLNYAENEKTSRRAAAAAADLDPAIKRLTESFKKQVETHEDLKRSVSSPAIPEGFRLVRAELIANQPLMTQALGTHTKLQEEAQRLAETNGGVLAASIEEVGAKAGAVVPTLSDIADGFVRLGQVSGGSFGEVMGQIGQLIVHLDNADKSTSLLGAIFAEGVKPAARFAAAVATIGNVVQGIRGILSSTSTEVNAFTNTLNGAAEGAQAGAAVGKGYGAALGAIAGAMAGYIRAHLNAQEATRQLRIEAGNLRDEFNDLYGNVVPMYETLGPIDERAKALGFSFNWVPKTTGEFKKLNAQLEEFAQVNQRISAVAAQAVGALGPVVEAMTAPWIDLGERMKEAAKKAKDAGAAYQQALKDGSSDEQVAKLKEAYDQASIALLELHANQASMAIEGKQQLADLGVQAMATFAAAMAAGDSFAVALGKVGPSLKTLSDGYKSLGVDVQDAGLKQLLLQAQISEGNPVLMSGINGLGSSMQALAQMGLLNADSFAAMQRTGMAMYTRLQAQVYATADASMTLEEKGRAALLPMQGYLQQAAAQAKLLGIPLDENTQRLIDQSEELGLWKEAGATAQDKLIAGMDILVGKVGELLDRMLGFSNAITGLPERRDVELNITENIRRNVTTINTEEGGPDGGFADGTYRTLGHDFPDFGSGTRTVLHGREAVVPEADRFAFAQRVLAGAAPGAGGGVVNNFFVMDLASGTTRQITEGEFDQIQDRLNSGRMSVPARAIAARAGR